MCVGIRLSNMTVHQLESLPSLAEQIQRVGFCHVHHVGNLRLGNPRTFSIKAVRGSLEDRRPDPLRHRRRFTFNASCTDSAGATKPQLWSPKACRGQNECKRREESASPGGSP